MTGLASSLRSGVVDLSGLLKEAIRERAAVAPLPWGGQGLTLSIVTVADLARRFGMPGYAVETTALELDIFPTRYLRNGQSIPAASQTKLLQSTIAQIGLGGLGGTLLEQFLRLGIGNIRAADGDTFEETNLNRQALAATTTMNRSKATAALDRAGELNPSVHMEATDRFLDSEDFPTFLQGCDLAVDALGGLASRLSLQQAAKNANIPMITGALAGWTGYVSVVMPGAPGPADFMGQDNGAEESLGCPAPTVTAMASIMASETVKLLTGVSSNLTGKLLIIDLLTPSFDLVTL